MIISNSSGSMSSTLRREPKTTNEQNEFQKYIRNFCSRFVQVVVHARMGIELNQPCKAPSDSDPTVWFNFKQEEFGEITAYLKSAIKRYPPDVSAISVDFFLHTASGDSLPLESWVVRVVPAEMERSVNLSAHLYRQLGTLLMSVCAAARATPAGRHYTRNQSEKTYVLCYRVYESEPELELLGPDYRSILLGNYPSPFGAIQVEFNYRTKMELTLPPYADEQTHQQQLAEFGDAGMLFKASIPIKKPMAQRSRLLVIAESKPKAKNWFNPMADALPFVADISRQRQQAVVPLMKTVESEPAIPTIYAHLPAEVLAAMPDELKSPQKPTSSECGSTPLSEFCVPLKTPDSFPFSSLFSQHEDEQKESHGGQSDSTSLSNFHFPGTANSSSDSSGSKRYDSSGDAASMATSVRDVVRQRQIKRDEVFGFLEDDESQEQQPSSSSRPRANSKPDVVFASSPLQAFTPPSSDFGPDLSDFMREVSGAPSSISSLDNDESRWLGAQINYFMQKADSLNTFVTSMQDAIPPRR